MKGALCNGYARPRAVISIRELMLRAHEARRRPSLEHSLPALSWILGHCIGIERLKEVGNLHAFVTFFSSDCD